LKINCINFASTERIKRIRENIISSKPRVSSERAVLITESYQETKGEPVVLRRAKALDKILKNMTLIIQEDELIVGNIAEGRRICPVFPEMDVGWLERELDTLETREYDQFVVTQKVKKELREIIPYWHEKTSLREKLFASFPEETKKARLKSGVFSITAHEESGLGHVLLDHERIIKYGLRTIIEETEKRIGELNLTDSKDIEKYYFLKAVKICLEATIAWANRYSQEAQRLAEKETDSNRKAELKKISEVCARVPEKPAHNLHEALQCIWFIHLIPQIETDGVAITIGRLDQYLYPLYKKTLAEGKMNKEQFQELLDCFWLKFSEMVKLYKLESAMITSGFPMGQNIVIGGTTAEGECAVNELSYMCLEAHRHCRLNQPNFSCRIYQTIPNDFLIRVCENIRMGTGHPELYNEDVAIASLLARGIRLQEARNYAPIGCVENSVIGMWMRANGGYFCLAKVLELAINNGKCQLTGDQVGPQTGYLEDFKEFSDLLKAYQQQTEYFVKHLVIENNLIDRTHAELVPIPFVSSLFKDCISSGQDVTAGGARYNFTCPAGVGVANTADGLAAIKKLVFDEEKISGVELRNALNSNFDGYEELRLLLNDAPKYGNDIPYVDSLARKAVDIFLDELDKYTNARGGQFVAGMTAITANIAFGKQVGATPDGRKAKEPLAEGISPAAGKDTKGPTAAMKSVTKIDHTRMMKGIIYNQKFNPSFLENREGLLKFSQMLRGYCDLNGFHVQFNIISADTLKDAQKNPDEYKDLVVRIAGYSAFYTELNKEVQDQIIARTEFNNIP